MEHDRQKMNGKAAGLHPFSGSLLSSPELLVKKAFEDASENSDGSPEAVQRIKSALNLRLLPFIAENWTIAERLKTDRYAEHARTTAEFLDARVAYIVCPDGRIAALSLGDPLVANVHRWLQGLPQTRNSTKRDSEPVLDDPYLSSALGTAISWRVAFGQNPEAVENVGPHIHSLHPEHGCGACINKLRARGHFSPLAMRMGGIAEYFEELGDHFYAFDNNAKRSGGAGTTVDFVHDAYSEGGIIGLRNQYRNFDRSLTLRENLIRMEEDRKILMTEALDGMFFERVERIASQKNVRKYIDIKDPSLIDSNAILIGEISREITEQEQEDGFLWIPSAVRDGMSETALKVLAYSSVRNSVYRILGGIRPGKHELEDHPERLVTIGPTSATFNRRNIPFVQKTHPYFTPQDIESGLVLYNLAADVMSRQGIDLTREGRIILTTGEFDASLYANEWVAQAQFDLVADIVKQNAARMRQAIMPSIRNGEAIVSGVIHEPVTRKIIAIV